MHYELNVTKRTNRPNWDNSDYTYVHYVRVNLGFDPVDDVKAKAKTIIDALNTRGDFKCSLYLVQTEYTEQQIEGMTQ